MTKLTTKWGRRDKKRRQRRNLDMVVTGRSTKTLLQRLAAKSAAKRLGKKKRRQRNKRNHRR